MHAEPTLNKSLRAYGAKKEARRYPPAGLGKVCSTDRLAGFLRRRLGSRLDLRPQVIQGRLQLPVLKFGLFLGVLRRRSIAPRDDFPVPQVRVEVEPLLGVELDHITFIRAHAPVLQF